MRQVMKRRYGLAARTGFDGVQGLPERPDGNNVNIDRESLLLSQTQLQFQLGVQLVKNQFQSHTDRDQGRSLAMGIFDMMNISASGASAERQRAEVTSRQTWQTPRQRTRTRAVPYVRKEVGLQRHRRIAVSFS
jgi:hypothetical protein